MVSLFSPRAPWFSAHLFFCDHVFFLSFSLSLSLPLLFAFGLFAAYFDAQPISCQHGPCRRSAKGYFLRLRERVRVRAALIFSLRQVHISPVRCAGLQQDEETTSSMFFPQSLQTNKRAGSLSTRMRKLSLHTGNNTAHTFTFRRRQVRVFPESMRRSSCQRRFGKACNLHDFRQ